MVIAKKTAKFPYPIETVWAMLTSLTSYAWRSDLDKIVVLDEQRFVEITRKGFETTFTVTVCNPCERWEFDMDNKQMKGHWIGIFTQTQDATIVEFIEEVMAKKRWMRPFVKFYLKQQQETYINDLTKALQKQAETMRLS